MCIICRCGISYKIDNYFDAHSTSLNTSVSEQVNKVLRELTTVLGYSTGANAVAQLELFIAYYNEEKNLGDSPPAAPAMLAAPAAAVILAAAGMPLGAAV